MKTFLIALIASLALIVPTSALASAGQIVLPISAGTLDYTVSGSPTPGTEQFIFNTPVPVEQTIIDTTNNDLRNTSAGDKWADTFINIRECSRIVFEVPAPTPTGDTGWHCTEGSNGHPTDPVITSLPTLADDTVSYLGVGRECPMPTDPVEGTCSTPGITQHPYHFPEVDLNPFIGQSIPGLLYANTCADVGETSTYGDLSITPLGCTGTITQIGGLASLMANPLSPPASFMLKTHKRAAFKSKRNNSLRQQTLRKLHH